MTWTKHGYFIEGTPVELLPPEESTNCGGPDVCLYCLDDAVQATGRPYHGKLPLTIRRKERREIAGICTPDENGQAQMLITNPEIRRSVEEGMLGHFSLKVSDCDISGVYRKVFVTEADLNISRPMKERNNMQEIPEPGIPETDRLRNGLVFASPRHPDTQHFGPHFAFGHLPEHLQDLSRRFARLGQYLVDSQEDGPELTVALRKLWESKNSAILHAGFIGDKKKEAP